jgi:hypothetical protein
VCELCQVDSENKRWFTSSCLYLCEQRGVQHSYMFYAWEQKWFMLNRPHYKNICTSLRVQLRQTSSVLESASPKIRAVNNKDIPKFVQDSVTWNILSNATSPLCTHFTKPFKGRVIGINWSKAAVLCYLSVGRSESAFISVPVVLQAVCIHYSHQHSVHRLVIVYSSN